MRLTEILKTDRSSSEFRFVLLIGVAAVAALCFSLLSLLLCSFLLEVH